MLNKTWKEFIPQRPKFPFDDDIGDEEEAGACIAGTEEEGNSNSNLNTDTVEECTINDDNFFFDDPCASFDSDEVVLETQVFTQVSVEPTQLSLAVVFDSQDTHLENSLS